MVETFNSSRRRRLVASTLAVAAVSFTSVPAFAADYPSKPIRMVVPFPPSGATDLVARMIAKSMGDHLGQPFVIENKPGAGGTIAASTVANAEPDGYTLLSTTAGIHVVNPAIYPKLPYDPVKSWAPIGQYIAAPLGVVVLGSSPFKTLQELIDHAKRNPGGLTYATPGNGTGPHLAGELFKNAAGVDLLHVPYRGAGPAVVDFRGGRVDIMFPYLGTMMAGLKSGEFRLLAIGSASRLPLMPDVPLVGDLIGQPGFSSDTWSGLTAPAGTPPAIVARLNAALRHALDQNRSQLIESGYLVMSGSAQDMQAQIDHELKTLTPMLARLMGEPK